MRRVLPQAFPSDPSVRTPGELGRAIRSARTTAGLTIVEAAAALGISRHTLISIERGSGSVAVATVLDAALQLGVALLIVPAARRESARRKLIDA
jgi:transcriptional regulator with XRE-family HTH domain